ncbi:hypothetical protein BD626DRAFT_637577 [Schizophyllum amplum]|uniref:Uncharacterized protein n=1 Tax=Schizophyllum amplum TaxID=97359 RepID=A0A550BS96_9AGAR|nr:hypothetical protein BD626DRAFT_637577 [Auriculariopsis ampla]
MASSYNDSTRYGAPPTTDALNFRPSARDSRYGRPLPKHGNTLRARPPKVPPFGAQIPAPGFPVTCLRAHDTALMRAQRIVEAGTRREREGSRVEGYIRRRPISLLPSYLPPPPSMLPHDELILIHLYLAHQLCKHPAPLPCHSQHAFRQRGTFLLDRITRHPRSPSYESPEITARDTFRLFLTTTTPPLSSLRRVSSSSAVWTLGSMLCTPTTTLRTLLLIAADNGGDLGDIGVGRRDCRHTPIPSSSLESAPRSSLESAPRSSFESASGVVWSAGPWASRHTRDPVPRETPREFNFGSHRIIDLVGPRRRQRSMLEVDAGPAEVAHPAEVARPCHRRHARPSRPSPRHLPHPYNPTWRSKRRISAQEFSGTSASGAEGDNEDGGGLPRRRRVAPLRISQVTCFRGSSPPSPTPL